MNAMIAASSARVLRWAPSAQLLLRQQGKPALDCIQWCREKLPEFDGPVRR
jgi:hypothetical protein